MDLLLLDVFINICHPIFTFSGIVSHKPFYILLGNILSYLPFSDNSPVVCIAVYTGLSDLLYIFVFAFTALSNLAVIPFLGVY